MAGEAVLFQRADIIVTPTRFMVGSKTYAARNIVSTRGLEERPGCIGALLGHRPVYWVLLATAAGELRAYESSDCDMIGDLLTALDKAIAGYH